MPDSMLNTPAEVKAALKSAPERAKLSRVLMASPEHFSVETAINPWMKTKSGRLNKVSPQRAMEQWQALKGAYEQIGIGVEVIEAGGTLPDFCFCANQSFPFLDGHARPNVILSRMKNESRAPEVPYYERWYSQRGWRVHELPKQVPSFEGMGDAIRHPTRRVIFGGIGPRTHESAWPEVAKLSDMPVIPVRLTDARFYHLDTCLACLDASRALWIPEAFDEPSRARISAAFADLIEVGPKDAANFACNAHCPDGRHVLLHKGSDATMAALKQRGFAPVEVDTGEFIKSGGSVFCLKLELP